MVSKHQFSLWWIPQDPIDDKQSLVQVIILVLSGYKQLPMLTKTQVTTRPPDHKFFVNNVQFDSQRK